VREHVAVSYDLWNLLCDLFAVLLDNMREAVSLGTPFAPHQIDRAQTLLIDCGRNFSLLLGYQMVYRLVGLS
jgi:hypothetical protein